MRVTAVSDPCISYTDSEKSPTEFSYELPPDATHPVSTVCMPFVNILFLLTSQTGRIKKEDRLCDESCVLVSEEEGSCVKFVQLNC